jgi:hypothetical protein
VRTNRLNQAVLRTTKTVSVGRGFEPRPPHRTANNRADRGERRVRGAPSSTPPAARQQPTQCATATAVNVAARVEQLTKTTCDAILLTGQCVDALIVDGPNSLTGGCMP